MRDEMREGDGVLFYASNADPSGVSGLAEIARGVGLRLEFHAGNQWIITSHLRAVAVEPSPERPC